MKNIDKKANEFLEKKSIVDSQVQIIHDLINKKAAAEEKAKSFIQFLPVFTEQFLTSMNNSEFKKESVYLKELFDSFAIIDEFTDFRIIDCYNEIKISLMKWERFADKTSSVAQDFKKLLDHFYEVMKELYFYEIFGFFSTTVHPEDLPELNLPCKIFCGCADGWQREPYLDAKGRVQYIDVVRFQDPKNKEVPLSIIIGGSAELLEAREKCSLNDNELRILCNFVNHHRGSIILHNASVIDSKQFIDSLKLRDRIDKSTYCIEFDYIKHISTELRLKLPSGNYYVDMNDMSYAKAKKFFSKISKEIKTEPENSEKSYHSLSLKILKCRPPVNKCCFCGVIMDSDGNSTWPIYYKRDAEYYRCCDECNKKYVIAARKDRKLIMQFRKQFNIDYTEYQE